MNFEQSPFTIQRHLDEDAWRKDDNAARLILSDDAACLTHENIVLAWRRKVNREPFAGRRNETTQAITPAILELFKRNNPDYTVEATGDMLFVREEYRAACSPDAIAIDDKGRRCVVVVEYCPNESARIAKHMAIVTGYTKTIRLRLCGSHLSVLNTFEMESEWTNYIELYRRFMACVDSKKEPTKEIFNLSQVYR